MLITPRIANRFAAAAREKGRRYFASGAVRIQKGTRSEVWATVRGPRVHPVVLSVGDAGIRVSCNCSSFQPSSTPCEHIWAALLAAEKAGYLGSGPSGVESRGRPRPEARGLGRQRPAEVDETTRDDEAGAGLVARGGRGPGDSWQARLSALQDAMAAGHEAGWQGTRSWPIARQIVYRLDLTKTESDPGRGLAVEIGWRQRKKTQGFTKPKPIGVTPAQVEQLPDAEDRRILRLLHGPAPEAPYGYWGQPLPCYRLHGPVAEIVLPALCDTGRLFASSSEVDVDPQPLAWDRGVAWEFWLKVREDVAGARYLVDGSLRRGDEQRPIAEPKTVTDGLVVWRGQVARLDDAGAFAWISTLRQHGTLHVPRDEWDAMFRGLLALPKVPRLDLPDGLRCEEVQVTPRPRLQVFPTSREWGPPRLDVSLSFDYDGHSIPARPRGRVAFDGDRRRLLVRDHAAEEAACDRMTQLGVKPVAHDDGFSLSPAGLPRLVQALVAEGWHVEAEGRLYRQTGRIDISVTSGIDWFEVAGGARFGDASASLPRLLAALKKGEKVILLDDGSFGMLPEDWLLRYGRLAGLGTQEGEHLRFGKTQVSLIDALLLSQPGVRADAAFLRARDRLGRFEGIAPEEPPAGFSGKLRPYQKDGLGWFRFLRDFGFGGCLADDMGLGKTVQVLALLESRRGGKRRPSLVVVPKSLLFNWRQEAQRFAPKLTLLEHAGITRGRAAGCLDGCDLVVTTYGTLRRDAALFKDAAFDYVILDESQAIKNAGTESARTVRLLRADHRLALSGTPIENHLGELRSLLDFLNPGLLGRSASAALFSAAGGDEESGRLLARALRPFILRRTKAQVAKDLPARLEQTVYCELEPEQRALYDELRDHYRRSLLKRIDRDGIRKSKIQVLEALLRLRQAACHPGLVDKTRRGQASAKLDVLLPRLAEVREEGHKAIVFSQFTSFLDILRGRIDAAGRDYEYLDGRTTDRGARVRRFQEDPSCDLFLVSLKAGGLGLNLTAAEYVFLLDPWWNPAVEAQAIDRAHRIGQTRRVFAYRLIARDTVEEKVLALQKTKRDLADAVIGLDNSLIRKLEREDLELLLS